MADRCRTARTVRFVCVSLVALALSPWSIPASVASERAVTVVFRGYNPNPPGTTGMDHLAASLSAARQDLSIRVYGDREIEHAFNFVNEPGDPDCLIMIGHSLGANAAIRLANRSTADGFDVDLLILLDSVGTASLRSSTHVKKALNYYQRPSSYLEWPRGRTSVAGTTAIHVERVYYVHNDIITHTTIDQPMFAFTEAHYEMHFESQSDLFARIHARVDAACPLAARGAGR